MLREQEYKGFKWRLYRPYSHNTAFIGVQVFRSPTEDFELTATDIYDLVAGKKHYSTINAEIRKIIDDYFKATGKEANNG